MDTTLTLRQRDFSLTLKDNSMGNKRLTREVVEGTRYQGAAEVVTYTITTTNWISDPTSPTITVYQIDPDMTETDVTDEVTSGSASVSGDIITLPVIQTLTAGTRYRVEVKFVVSAQTFECYFYIEAEV